MVAKKAMVNTKGAEEVGKLTGERLASGLSRERTQIPKVKTGVMTAHMDNETDIVLDNVDPAVFKAIEGGMMKDAYYIVVYNKDMTECVMLAWNHVVSIEVKVQ